MSKAKPDDDPLYEPLRTLALDQGVFRDDLYEALGRDLRKFFDIDSNPLNIADLRKQVTEKMERLLSQHVENEQARHLARVAYNYKVDEGWSEPVRVSSAEGGSPVEIRNKRLQSVFNGQNGLWEYNTIRSYLRSRVLVPIIQGIRDEQYQAQAIEGSPSEPTHDDIPDNPPSEPVVSDSLPTPKLVERGRNLTRYRMLVALGAVIFLVLAVILLPNLSPPDNSPTGPATTSPPSQPIEVVSTLIGPQVSGTLVVPSLTVLSPKQDRFISQPPDIFQHPDQVLREVNGLDMGIHDQTTDVYLFAMYGAYGAKPTNSGFANLTITAATKVEITGIGVWKVCHEVPLGDMLFYYPSTVRDTTVSLGFDLDSSITYAQDRNADGSYSGNYFQEHSVTLEQGESKKFPVYVTTTRHDCTFDFDVDVNTSQGTFSVNSGQQLKLVAAPDPTKTPSDFSAYNSVYVFDAANAYSEGMWVQVNPRTYKGVGDPRSFPMFSSH